MQLHAKTVPRLPGVGVRSKCLCSWTKCWHPPQVHLKSHWFLRQLCMQTHT